MIEESGSGVERPEDETAVFPAVRGEDYRAAFPARPSTGPRAGVPIEATVGAGAAATDNAEDDTGGEPAAVPRSESPDEGVPAGSTTATATTEAADPGPGDARSGEPSPDAQSLAGDRPTTDPDGAADEPDARGDADSGADDMAPDDMAPDDMAPDDMAPDDMARDDMARDDMAPDDPTPDDAAVAEDPVPLGGPVDIVSPEAAGELEAAGDTDAAGEPEPGREPHGAAGETEGNTAGPGEPGADPAAVAAADPGPATTEAEASEGEPAVGANDTDAPADTAAPAGEGADAPDAAEEAAGPEETDPADADLSGDVDLPETSAGASGAEETDHAAEDGGDLDFSRADSSSDVHDVHDADEAGATDNDEGRRGVTALGLGASGGGPEGTGDDAAPAFGPAGGVGADRPGGRIREEALPDAAAEALTAALTTLRESVRSLRFELDMPGSEEARKARAELLAQLGDYAIPRVRMSTAPALIVVAGSTGAGKSTLVNTLAGAKVTATGVRRPTTGTPVLACHPDDREWYAEGDLLGGLRRVDHPDDAETGTDSLVLATSEWLPQGVALLDTPDIDSVVETHHDVARRMLDAGDLWVFVTTAARYADAPAWRLLRLAKERGARLAIVLSRVPPRSREVIVKHFVRMLTEYGLGEVQRFVINESTVTEGRLPDQEVSGLRMWLAELSVDDQRRAQAVQATLNGVLDSFRTRVPALARHLEAQVAVRAELRADIDVAYTAALAHIDESTRNGSLFRGEVVARWQDFVGSGDVLRTLQLRRPGRFGGQLGSQAPERSRALKSALRTGLESVIIGAAQQAAEDVVARWRRHAGIGERLAATRGLDGVSDELTRWTARSVAAWQDHMVELIRTEGVTKRSVAKLLSFDEESLSLIFMVGLFGYGTPEAAVDGGSGALPQRLLRALLGAESLRSISVKARSDLRARVGVLFDEEMSRYTLALDRAGIPDESAATRLYQATYNLEVVR